MKKVFILAGMLVFSVFLTTVTFAGNWSEEFTFVNKTGQVALDLHVEFNKKGVNVIDRGPFKKHKGDGQKIDLSKGEVANKGNAVIDFEHLKRKDVKITMWWWTDQAHKPIGKKHEKPPEEPKPQVE